MTYLEANIGLATEISHRIDFPITLMGLRRSREGLEAEDGHLLSSSIIAKE